MVVFGIGCLRRLNLAPETGRCIGNKSRRPDALESGKSKQCVAFWKPALITQQTNATERSREGGFDGLKLFVKRDVSEN